MRQIDRRTQVTRRVFLRGSATAVPAAAFVAAGATISPTAAWAQSAKTLQPATLATLVLVARDIYPHDHVADVFYIKAVTPWDDKATKDPATKVLLEEGVMRLDAGAQDQHGVPYLQVGWEDQRVALLRGIEASKFFQTLRGDLLVSFYNQHDLWKKFGYEGASAEYGGYIHRGFDDIDWLPQA
ncbi:MAG TPA: gluconate 2-dehydrogenase subunit 3 family protein [Acetobacteraceae bacterium]|nr:gluconate 2-dehydrogenase subunit 3 family protein [Acetobacteraceae bacterium]